MSCRAAFISDPSKVLTLRNNLCKISLHNGKEVRHETKGSDPKIGIRRLSVGS